MSQRLLLRLGAAAGLLAAVLGTAGFSLLLAYGMVVTEAPTSEKMAGILAVPQTGPIMLGRILQVLAMLLLLIFNARVWLSLRLAEGEPAWVSLIAFGAGLALPMTGIGSQAAEYTLGFGAALSVESAMAIIYLNRAFYVLTWGLAALWLGAIAVVVLGTQSLPRWLGWSAALLALANLASSALPLVDLAQLPPMFFRLWLIALSIVLIRRSPEPGLAAAGARITTPAIS